jgi:integrase
LRRTQGTQKSFTATRVASLPVGRHKDPSQPSLYLLVRARASAPPSRSWLHRIKIRGRDTFLLIGHFPETSLSAARDIVRRQREFLAQGIDPRRAMPRRRPLGRISAQLSGGEHTIEFLAAEFVERYLRPNRKRPGYAEAIIAKDILTTWAGRDVRTIKPREVINLLDKIVARGSPIMANRTAAVLDQMFRFAIHRAVVDDSPVKLLMRPGGKEKARERVLTDEELKAFLSAPRACTRFERLSHVITLLLLTGQRRGELALAKWSDIDLKERTWAIRDENSKTGRGHVVPLSDWAVEEFAALKREAEGSPWVLPAAGGSHHIDPKQLTRSLAKCIARFRQRGIKHFVLHDLRRTCRTGLSRLGVEQHIGERVLNHAQPGVVGVYDRHAYLEEKREALEKWAMHLAGLRYAPTENTAIYQERR